MVPNLTLIEVRPTTPILVLTKGLHKPFVLFRRRSSLSRYQRFSRRTCPRRMPRNSRRSLRVSEPSSPWSELGLMACLTYLLPLHNLPLPPKTYLPPAQFNARIMGLELLEVIHRVMRPISSFSPPTGENNEPELDLRGKPNERPIETGGYLIQRGVRRDQKNRRVKFAFVEYKSSKNEMGQRDNQTIVHED